MFGKQAIVVKAFFSFSFFSFLALLFRLTYVQLQNYVSQARFTEPKQTLITDKRLFNKVNAKGLCRNTRFTFTPNLQFIRYA